VKSEGGFANDGTDTRDPPDTSRSWNVSRGRDCCVNPSIAILQQKVGISRDVQGGMTKQKWRDTVHPLQSTHRSEYTGGGTSSATDSDADMGLVGASCECRVSRVDGSGLTA
jgi:hypothetical protein